jgi:hypothetical protein
VIDQVLLLQKVTLINSILCKILRL